MFDRSGGRASVVGLLGCVLLSAALPTIAYGQTAGFVAPPRNISDITAILDQQRADPSRAARARAEADANPPAGAGAGALGQFYFNRCQARAAVGRNRDSIDDCEKAISYGGDYVNQVSRYQQFLSNQYRSLGEFKKSIELEQQMARKFEEIERNKGRFFGINLRIAIAYLNMGDLKQAELHVKKNQALLQESKGWRNVAIYVTGWESTVEQGNARLLEARGRYRDAELGYERSAVLLRDALVKSASWPNPPPKGSMESTIDFLTAFAGMVKMRQGRLSEAEADVRRALLGRLKAVGKYHGETAQITTMLAGVLSEQARFADAEQIARTSVDIYRSLGFPADAPLHASALNQLASTLFSQRRWDDAEEIYAVLDEATRNWEQTRRDRIRLGWARIFTNYFTRKVPAGIELAQLNVARAKARVGEKHFEYAMAQATLGTGFAFARRDAEALQVFASAMPVLLASTRHGEDDSASAVAFGQRLSHVIEAYLALLARTPDASGSRAAESFQLGEMIRGRSVEKALSASSARAVVRDAALAELARKEQDLEKQIAAELGNLNNILAQPPGERDDNAVRELQASVDKLRAARAAARRDIEKRFPSYANLVAPKPPTIEEIRAALRPDEAFLSFYFGRRGSSFVWAVPKQGPVAFAAVEGAANLFDRKVQKLREALDPKAATVDEIPQFDLALAHELYAQLLRPVEAGWKPAST